MWLDLGKPTFWVQANFLRKTQLKTSKNDFFAHLDKAIIEPSCYEVLDYIAQKVGFPRSGHIPYLHRS